MKIYLFSAGKDETSLKSQSEVPLEENLELNGSAAT